MNIGILGYQGGIDEHKYMVIESCKELGIQCSVETVVKPQQLNKLDGLIIPGGESTTIVKLAKRYNMIEEIKSKLIEGLPVLGTCAGAIFLAKKVTDLKTRKELQGTIGLLDVIVVRNFYGRQKESFEIDLEIPTLGEKPFRAIFIRAPAIIEISGKVKPLAIYGENYVFVQQDAILATVFHPELSGDTRIHRYFLEIVKK
ncbi:MAG: pyridoxal 5'-phosphate synthase glutaminase subunit PdxT [Ignisphaera sp.]